MAIAIWEWCTGRTIWLSATHTLRSENTYRQADRESRELSESTEWYLSQVVSNSIKDSWGPFDIHLFASWLNFKVSIPICFKATWPWSTICECFLHELETSLFLCLSTFQCHCQLPTEDQTGAITLDNTTLVYTPLETAKTVPSPTSSVGQPSAPAPQQSSSSLQQTPATKGLQSVRKSFQQQAISSKAANIILQSWSTVA